MSITLLFSAWRGPSRQRFRTFDHFYNCVFFYLLHWKMGFLGNLVKVFPSLRSRPLYITGESYAGQYIVSLLFFFSIQSKLNRSYHTAIHTQSLLWYAKSTRENGKNCNRWWILHVSGSLHLCNYRKCTDLLRSHYTPCLRRSQISVLETYPQIIGYDQAVYNYFRDQQVYGIWSDFELE